MYILDSIMNSIKRVTDITDKMLENKICGIQGFLDIFSPWKGWE